MKYLLCIVLTALAVTRHPTIQIIRSNGGVEGFYDIHEKHDDSGNHYLICKGKGYDAGKWTIMPEGLTHYSALMAYANREVANQKKSGAYSVGGETIHWDGTDSLNCKYTIEIK